MDATGYSVTLGVLGGYSNWGKKKYVAHESYNFKVKDLKQ